MSDDEQIIDIGPQPGPQEMFVGCQADIAIYGGQAGGGKSYGLLLAALQHVDLPGYGAVIFRRTEKQITAIGGLWKDSLGLYSLPGIDGNPKASDLDWTFPTPYERELIESGAKVVPSGAQISFRSMQHAANVKDWMGSQIPFIGFDELTHFTQEMFFYLLTRCRTTCGIDAHMRATCNPIPADDPIGGWVHQFLQWWIDEETGLAIEERSGVIRWLIVVNNEWIWADTREEMFEKHGKPDLPLDHDDQIKPKSVTFIIAKLSDNPKMREADPNYRSNLEAQPQHIRDQLLGGNWNAKPRAGTFFLVGEIEVVEAAPVELRRVRAWDLAATKGAGDWTAGVLLGEKDGIFYIEDVKRGQWEASYRDDVIKQTANIDSDGGRRLVRTHFPEDPGAGGKVEGPRLVRLVAPNPASSDPVPRASKIVRATGAASQLNAGNFKMVIGPWNAGLLARLDQFPSPNTPDDEVDALADAFIELKKPIITAVVSTADRVDVEAEISDKEAKARFGALVPNRARDIWEKLMRDAEPMDPSWKTLRIFLADVGEAPSVEHELNPINPNEKLGPGNFWWGKPGEERPEKPPQQRNAVVGSR